MPPFIADVRTAISGAVCGGFNTYDRVARWTANLTYPDRVDAVYPLSPAGQIANAGIALFCDRQPYQPTTFVKNFTGGQCLTDYSVQATTDRYINGAVAQMGQIINAGFDVAGPIRSVQISPNQEKIRVEHGVNLSFDMPSGTSAGGTQRRNLRNIIVATRNGSPDNCGDRNFPIPTPLPQADRTFPININNNGGQIVVGDGNLNVNGDLVAPFTLISGQLNLTGNIFLNTGQINLNFGGQPSEPIEPGINATPDDDTGPGDEGDDEEGPSNIIGAVVIASPVIGSGPTEIFQPDAPNIFPPKIGHLSFKIKIGSRFHWTSDIDIKNQNNFIHNPTVLPAVRVVAHPNPGWTIEVTPVRGIIPDNDIVLI